MSEFSQEPLRRVLIASANPLFARGLQKMVAQRWEDRGVEIRLAGSMQEALDSLEDWQPDLVIVDYDDVGRPGSIQREAFLNHFIAGKRAMQVMLVSLGASGEVIVYDRRTLTPDQAEDWLDLPWASAEPGPERSHEGIPDSTSQFNPRSGSMKHYVIVGVFTAILTALTYLALHAVGLLPVAASEQAGVVDRMVYLQLWMISFLFSLIVVFIVYSVIVFRRRKGEEGDGAYFKSSTRLEVLWTLFPLVTVIYLSFLGAQALSQVRQAEPNPVEINVTAFQWGWIFDYPDQGVQSNVLYMPVDRQALFHLTSRDVIHSFWVPEFRVKQDVLPGENLVKDLRITPTKIGEYTLRCAEMCGGAHAYMTATVKVVSQADYDAWLAEQSGAADLPPAERGQRLAEGSGCLACHSLDGTRGAGPTWKGLAGHEVKLQSGETVTADDAYLHESIIDPNAQVVEGFPPIMPGSYGDTLSDAQIADIITFIKSVQ